MILMCFFAACSLYSSVDGTACAHVSQLFVFCLDLHSSVTPATSQANTGNSAGHGDQLSKEGDI